MHHSSCIKNASCIVLLEKMNFQSLLGWNISLDFAIRMNEKSTRCKSLNFQTCMQSIDSVVRFLNSLPEQKIFPSKNIPVTRICLPHWHTQIICLRYIVVSVFTKSEVLAAKTWKISRGIFVEFR